jgi:serine/threonine-protein kinase
MKRTAGEYAVLLALLDEALDLDVAARDAWIDALPESHAHLRPALRRMLSETLSQVTAGDAGLQEQIAAVVQDAVKQPDTAELKPGEHIGPYELVREIGRGGMGFVWLADRADGAFKRAVALKLPFTTWTGRLSERMGRERDILAGLEHPNIARFYDAGVDALERPFMAMEYVEGQAIDVYCRERNLSIRERLFLLLDVAKAVAYAHSKLVVHRDLKPANDGRSTAARFRDREAHRRRHLAGVERDAIRGAAAHARLRVARADPRGDHRHRRRYLFARGGDL